jgi:uncharacterized membrane protein YdbT with pleckstrin-like domain
MSYVSKILQPDETVVYLTRPHWLLYFPAILVFLAALAVLWVSAWFAGDLTLVARSTAAALAVVGIALWLHAFVKRATTELAVTNRRVIYKAGVVMRHTVEMNMDKIESVNVDQSILGRILDYGTVTMHGTGGGLEPFPNIASPIAFRNRVTAS